MSMSLPPPRVLIVDDDEDTREMYTWSLNAKGFSVIPAGSGVNALAEAGVEQPDIVVTDFTLPGMTGVELATRLKESPATTAPVVLLTGHDPTGAWKKQVLQVCDRILLKPMLPDHLADEITRVLLRSTSEQHAAQLREAQRKLAGSEAAPGDVLAAVAAARGHVRRPVAILVADDEGCYLAANDAAVELTGFSREELLTKSVWDITSGQEMSAVKRMWQDFIRSGSLDGTYIVSCADGRTASTSFSALANVAPHLHASLLVPMPTVQTSQPAA